MYKRQILARVRRLGYAEEDSEVSAGFGSVALALTSRTYMAAVAVTWEQPLAVGLDEVLARLRQTVDVIDARLR